MTRLLATALVGIALGGPAVAGTIERACVNSERGAQNRQLCGCIQQVADATLDRRDQRLAAKFFRDPHHAQEIRQSHRSNHEVFWQKYRAFGEAAESYCS